jgi:hypothetical protein
LTLENSAFRGPREKPRLYWISGLPGPAPGNFDAFSNRPTVEARVEAHRVYTSMIRRIVIPLAAWGITLGVGLLSSAPGHAQVIYPAKSVPLAVEASPQVFPSATVPQVMGPSLAATPPLAASPPLLVTRPAVPYQTFASPQGPCQNFASPQASDQSFATPQASAQSFSGSSCACYYPQGRCPFPSGNCAFPSGNCVAPAGSCVGGPPVMEWPQGSPQVSPQASARPLVSDRIAKAK